MIDKGTVIKEVFLLCGNNNSYNDNGNDEYKLAERLLNSVLDNIAKESSFMFNAITVKLNKASKQNSITGEVRYNKPHDMLNCIRGNNDYRLEGEYIYSNSDELMIQYCRKISLEEFPDNLYSLLVASLFMKISMAFNSYNDRYQFAREMYEDEKRKVIYQQGFVYDPFGG